VDGERIVVGGNFNRVFNDFLAAEQDSIPVNCLAIWDGAVWRSPGLGEQLDLETGGGLGARAVSTARSVQGDLLEDVRARVNDLMRFGTMNASRLEVGTPGLEFVKNGCPTTGCAAEGPFDSSSWLTRFGPAELVVSSVRRPRSLPDRA
jgi:hypothetical protein